MTTTTVVILSTNKAGTRILKPCIQLPHCCFFGRGADRPAAVEAGQQPLTRFCLSDLPQACGTECCYTQKLGNMTLSFSTSPARKVEWRLEKIKSHYVLQQAST